jgi:hypothetical protein
LDKADDPSKMIRMIILEMEETLVEVRASAARTIADQKEMQRHVVKLDRLAADWAERPSLPCRRTARISPARPSSSARRRPTWPTSFGPRSPCSTI